MWRGWGNRCNRALPDRSSPWLFPRYAQPIPRRSAGTGPAPDDPRQVLDLAVGGRSGAHVLLDLEDAVTRGGVVAAAEGVSDLDQRLPAALPHQVHRHVPGRRERAGPVRRDE